MAEVWVELGAGLRVLDLQVGRGLRVVREAPADEAVLGVHPEVPRCVQEELHERAELHGGALVQRSVDRLDLVPLILTRNAPFDTGSELGIGVAGVNLLLLLITATTTTTQR